MKTLIITGIWLWHETEPGVICYEVDLFGQTKEQPECIYIKSLEFETNIGYDDLIDKCKVIYCSYYGTDEYNIITITRIKEK
jgi:hypothetical protein